MSEFQTALIFNLKFANISLRSKRFRLVSGQKKTEGRDSRFDRARNETRPCTIFPAVFDSCSSFFATKTAQKGATQATVTRSQMKPHGEIWTLSMNRKILFLPLKDTFRAIAKLVVLK